MTRSKLNGLGLWASLLAVLFACNADEAEEGDDEGGRCPAWAYGDGDGDGDGSTAQPPGGQNEGEPEEEQPTFIPLVDAGQHRPCDPFLQDCPSWQKCMPLQTTGETWDANICVDVMGVDEIGEACLSHGVMAGTDTCNESGLCWQPDEQGIGTCVPFCSGSAEHPVCDWGSSCSVGGDGVLNACIPICSPIEQDCAEGQGCYWADDTFRCLDTAGALPSGWPCRGPNDCDAGTVCVDATVVPACESARCCTEFCDFGVPASCALADQGAQCVPWFADGEAPPLLAGVGACALPQ